MSNFLPEPTGRPIDDVGPRVRSKRGGIRQANATPELERRFIAWDGEGQDLNGPDKPQTMVLFGASTGDILLTPDRHPDIGEFCMFITDVGRRFPGARHIGYAFDYDANMVMQSMSRHLKIGLHQSKRNYVSFTYQDVRFGIQYYPSKWFRVTRYGQNYKRKANSRDKISVKIENLFNHHHSSFVAAVHEAFGCGDEVLETGKNTPVCGYKCVETLPQIGETASRWYRTL
jgi:hypothetical protein